MNAKLYGLDILVDDFEWLPAPLINTFRTSLRTKVHSVGCKDCHLSLTTINVAHYSPLELKSVLLWLLAVEAKMRPRPGVVIKCQLP